MNRRKIGATELTELVLDPGSWSGWDAEPVDAGPRAAAYAEDLAAAERLVLAVERATRERLPLVVSPPWGGARMQEGAVAFLQVVKISAAVAQHRAAGLPYLVYLRHPTTGGVLRRPAAAAAAGQLDVPARRLQRPDRRLTDLRLAVGRPRTRPGCWPGAWRSKRCPDPRSSVANRRAFSRCATST